MVDLTPKVSMDAPSQQKLPTQEDVKIKLLDAPSKGDSEKLKLSLPLFPMAMSNANGFGIATTTMLMSGLGAGGNLSEKVSAYANAQGIYSITNNVSEIPREVPIEDPLMNRPLEYNIPFSGLSVNSGVNYNVIKSRRESLIDNSIRPSLDVSASGNMDLLMNRGGGRLNATLSEGNQHGGLRLNFSRGRDIVKSDTGYVQTASQGWSLDGSVREEIGGGRTLFAMAGVSKNEMTIPKSTQPGAINYGDGVIKSETYYANVVLAEKRGSVSVNVSASDDNLGYRSRTAGVGAQIGATSVNGNVMCRASAEEGYKCNNVGVNVRHTW